VRYLRPTKAPAAQIRQARTATGDDPPGYGAWDKVCLVAINHALPII
jgi:hypothetical protein